MFLCGHIIILCSVCLGIETLTITSFVATGNAILGPSNVQLSCSYTRSPQDLVMSISLLAKINGTFQNIASFASTRREETSVTSPYGDFLKNRVTLSNPSSYAANVTTKAVMTFNKTECEDDTDYKCIVVYFNRRFRNMDRETRETHISVKGKPAISDNVPRWTPESGIEEGTDVTFTCTGNVGKPPGKFKWTKYSGSTITEYPATTTTAVDIPGTCTFKGNSSLTIRLMAEDNNAIIKCAIEQELATNNTFRQNFPDELVVYYQVRNIQITKSPNLESFTERASYITLMCSADGNPTPTYTWHKDTDIHTVLATGNTFRLLQIVTNTGNYVCVAHNGYNGKSKNLTLKEHIHIDRISDNSGLVGGVIFLSVLQVCEVFLVFILYRKEIVIVRFRKKKVYEDVANNRPDNHVYSTMNSASVANDGQGGEDNYYNL